MKLSLISIAAFCISGNMALSHLPASANTLEFMPAAPPVATSTPQTSLIQTIDASATVEPSAAVEPMVLSTQGSAADLLVEDRSPIAPAADRSQTFNVTAEQINQNLSGSPEQPNNPLSALTERFTLPEGMVVRGVNRGGIAIGSELP